MKGVTAMRPAPRLLLVVAAAPWGLAAALSKLALQQLTPLDLFGIEVTVGMVPLAVLATSRGARFTELSPPLLALGLLEPGLSYVLFDFGVRHTSAIHSALLLATETPLTVLFAVLFLRESTDALTIAAVASAVAGSLLVSADGAGHGAGTAGDVVVLASAATAAGYAVLARHLVPAHDPFIVTAVQMLGASFLAVPAAVGAVATGHSHLNTADPWHLAVACLVGVLAGVVPFLLFNLAISHVSATHAGLILVLVPVFGAGASVALVADPITWRATLGGLLAVAGAAMVTRRTNTPARVTEPKG